MTERAKRGSNICGIATRNWPASDFKAPSAATGRPSCAGLAPYTSIHGFRCTLAQKSVVIADCPSRLLRRYPYVIAPPPRPAHRELKPCGRAFDLHITGGMTMTIKVGDELPSVTLRQVTPEGPKEINTEEFFRGNEVACVAVNDAAVMTAWGKDQKTEGKVTMLADGSGDFVRALGLELDLTKAGLGIRSKRYSMLVDDGVVKSLNIEQQPGQVDVSSAQAMLRAL